MNKPKKSRPLGGLADHSLILSAFLRLSLFLYAKLPASLIGYLLTHKSASSAGLVSRANDRIGFRRRISIPCKRFLARTFEQSFFLTKAMSLIRRLPLLQFKCIGIFYFSFGLYTSVAFTLERFALNRADTPTASILLGLSAAIGGAIFSASNKSCGEAVTESRVLSFLFFRVLGIKPEILQITGTVHGRGNVAFLCGLGVGAIGSFLSPMTVFLGLPLLALAVTVLLLPESGVVILLLSLPLLSTMQAAALTTFVVLAWFLKLLRGKRVLATTSLDLSIVAFMLILFLGGVISITPKESLRVALLMCSLMGGYFITVNLIRTSAWLYRCLGALIASLTITALIGTVEYLLGLSPLNWLDSSMLSLISGRAVSLFGNPNVLAEMLVLLLPFPLARMLFSRHGDTRIGYASCLLLSLICLVFTWSRGGWLAAMLAIAVFLLIQSRHAVAKLLAALLALPSVIALLPQSIVTRFCSSFDITDSSIAYRFGIFRGVENLLADCFVGGIGLGEAAFRRIYPLYALQAIEEAPHTHNLYTQLAVSLGITGLLFFFTVLLLFLRHCFSYFADSRFDDPKLRFAAVAGFSGICGFLLMGFFDYVFYNYRIFLLFWLILGLTSAAIRTGIRERISVRSDGPSLDLELY